MYGRTSILILACALASVAASANGGHAPAVRATFARGVPAHPVSTETGHIEGTVTVARRPARRVVQRYPGAVGPNARRAPPVPTVVYLEGPVGEGDAEARAPDDALRLIQADTTFRPAALVVPVGARVEFPNRDPFFHNVFSFSRAKRFDLGRYPEGEVKSVVFDEPGVVKIFCEIHTWMRAAVIVAENPYHATIAEDGSFRIEDVPAGRHRLTVWDFDHGDRTVEIDVPADGAARVDIEL